MATAATAHAAHDTRTTAVDEANMSKCLLISNRSGGSLVQYWARNFWEGRRICWGVCMEEQKFGLSSLLKRLGKIWKDISDDITTSMFSFLWLYLHFFVCF